MIQLLSDCYGGKCRAGQDGFVVQGCVMKNKTHFHAAITREVNDHRSYEQWLHQNGWVCNNPKRWGGEPNYIGCVTKCYHPSDYTKCECECHKKNEPKPSIQDDMFWEDLEEELDKLFPKGKCKERGAALCLFAYAIILHKKSKIYND